MTRSPPGRRSRISQVSDPASLLQPHHHAVRRALRIDHRHARETRAVRCPGRLPAQIRLAERHAIDDPAQRQHAAFGFQGERASGWLALAPARPRSTRAPSGGKAIFNCAVAAAAEGLRHILAQMPQGRRQRRGPADQNSRRAGAEIHARRRALQKHRKEPAPPPDARRGRTRRHCPAGRARPRSCAPCRSRSRKHRGSHRTSRSCRRCGQTARSAAAARRAEYRRHTSSRRARRCAARLRRRAALASATVSVKPGIAPPRARPA